MEILGAHKFPAKGVGVAPQRKNPQHFYLKAFLRDGFQGGGGHFQSKYLTYIADFGPL